VMEPRWRPIGAAVGRDAEIIVAVAGVDEAVRPGRARATTSSSEQQGRDADHPMPNAPVGSLIELLVDLEDLARDAHTTQPIERPAHRPTSPLWESSRVGSGGSGYRGSSFPVVLRAASWAAALARMRIEG